MPPEESKPDGPLPFDAAANAAVLMQSVLRKWLAERYYKGRFLHNKTDVYGVYQKLVKEQQVFRIKVGARDRFVGQLLKPHLAECLLVGSQCHDIGRYAWALDALKGGLRLQENAVGKYIKHDVQGCKNLKNLVSRRLAEVRGSLFEGLPLDWLPQAAKLGLVDSGNVHISLNATAKRFNYV